VLFNNVESLDTAQRAAGGEDVFGFTFDVGNDKDDKSEEDSEDNEEAAKVRAAKKVEADKKRAAARDTKHVGGGRDDSDGEVDIDAI